MEKKDAVLYIVIPAYNEEANIEQCIRDWYPIVEKYNGGGKSRLVIIDDGSKDKTWDLIKELSEKDEHFIGICQSRNRGHQNAVLAGMMEAKDVADITISIDCDGQDDIAAMEAMVDRYHEGCEIVYGVR